jgi:hypothetical protein
MCVQVNTNDKGFSPARAAVLLKSRIRRPEGADGVSYLFKYAALCPKSRCRTLSWRITFWADVSHMTTVCRTCGVSSCRIWSIRSILHYFTCSSIIPANRCSACVPCKLGEGSLTGIHIAFSFYNPTPNCSSPFNGYDLCSRGGVGSLYPGCTSKGGTSRSLTGQRAAASELPHGAQGRIYVRKQVAILQKTHFESMAQADKY